MLRSYVASLESISPLSQSRYYETEDPKRPQERDDEYRRRTWRNYAHASERGTLVIPGMGFKNGLVSAATTLQMKLIKGKGTYTKLFKQAIIIANDLDTGIPIANIEPEHLFLPSDGKPGSGSRVPKIYPRVMSWAGTIEITVGHEAITKQILLDHLTAMGAFVGLGRWRPEKNGMYGRFRVLHLDGEDDAPVAVNGAKKK